MNIHPLKDKILVRAKAIEQQTASGIVIPETTNKERPQEGEVIAVGTGRVTPEGVTIPMGINIGDKILFSRYSPTEIKLDGEELLILSESDVLAIIK